VRTRWLLALAVTPLVTLAACGSGDKGQSRSDMIANANGVCDRAERKSEDYARERSSPQGQDQVRAALEADIRIADQAAKELDALDPGAEQKADFERYVAALRGMSAGNREFVQAIGSNDSAGLRDARLHTVEQTGRAKRAAVAYGLDACPYKNVAVQFANAADAQKANRDPLGTWSGNVIQYGPGEHRSRYRTVMTVRDVSVAGGPAGSIDYPSFPCAGDLQFQGSKGNRYSFRERITSNAKKCTTGGRITATVAGERMGWRWVRGGVEVLGTLRRR
jgi:hypothetical protein